MPARLQSGQRPTRPLRTESAGASRADRRSPVRSAVPVLCALVATLALFLAVPLTHVVTRFVAFGPKGAHAIAAVARPLHDVKEEESKDSEPGSGSRGWIDGRVPRETAASEDKSGGKPVVRPRIIEVPVLEETPAIRDDSTNREFVFNVSDLDLKPTAVMRRPPVYPYDLIQQGLEGRVTARFIVDREGRTRELEIVSADHPEFAKAVMDALRDWRFVPGSVRGRRVEFRMQLPVLFVIEGSGTQRPAMTAAIDLN